MKVGTIFENLEITGMSSEGMGIGKPLGLVIFVEKSIPGDVVHAEIKANKKNYLIARIKEIVTPSPNRIKPVCEHFGMCGGCNWQYVTYEEQLKYKQEIVERSLEKIGKVATQNFLPIKGCEQQYFYRNKLEYTYTNRIWLTQAEIATGADYERRGLGYHMPGMYYAVLNVNKCHLQQDPSNAIRIWAKNYSLENDLVFYNLKKQDGLMRNQIIRITSAGQILVIMSFHENNEAVIFPLLEAMKNAFPEITSLQYVINHKLNNAIFDLEVKHFAGEKFIIEQLGDFKFKIGPKSFFQTNSKQAKILYDVVKDFAALTKEDVVYDLYSGVGSIGIYVSRECKKVVGIEEIKAAVEDAAENARLNGVKNCSFHDGDVRLILNPEFLGKHGKPDVIITDPPRSGMHPDVVNTLLLAEVPRIVYVSCSAATQARDLNLLSEKYEVLKSQAVDMFPQTTHIENVVLLQLKSSL